MWPLSSLLAKLEMTEKYPLKEEVAPLQSFSGHGTKGYSLAWSSSGPGVLASGDCNKNIHVWNPGEGGTRNIATQPILTDIIVINLVFTSSIEHIFMCKVIFRHRAFPVVCDHEVLELKTQLNLATVYASLIVGPLLRQDRGREHFRDGG